MDAIVAPMVFNMLLCAMLFVPYLSTCLVDKEDTKLGHHIKNAAGSYATKRWCKGPTDPFPTYRAKCSADYMIAELPSLVRGIIVDGIHYPSILHPVCTRRRITSPTMLSGPLCDAIEFVVCSDSQGGSKGPPIHPTAYKSLAQG